MTATGFAFFLPALLGQIESPLPATLGMWFVDLWSVLFIALLVSLFNAGRLESTVDKLLVFAFVLPLLILNFVWLLFAEEVEPNMLLAFPDKQIADATRRSGRSSSARASPRCWCSACAGGRRRGLGGARCSRRSRGRSSC